MRLKTYRAATMAGAMSMVRAELGADALILATRRVGHGVEVTAALEPAEPEIMTAGPAESRAALPPPGFVPAPLVRDHASERGLLWHGVPPELARRLAQAPLAVALAETLRFGTLPLARNGPPLLLAGPPGAGKTLTVARLATRLVLAGEAPLVVTADGRRAGAAEELAAYTRLLGLELLVAATPRTLTRALTRRRDGHAVLIDTSGVCPYAPGEITEIAALAASVAAIPAMVLPAGMDAQEAADHAAAFGACGVKHFVPTRLDMSRRLGAVVAAAIAGRMTLSEAGTGPGANDGLTRLTAESLAQRLSRVPAPQAAPAPALDEQAYR